VLMDADQDKRVRFFAKRSPATNDPTVYCGEVAGPNVAALKLRRSMLGAHLTAWRWNQLERRAERKGWRD
jgi:hypothetical protein